LAQLDVDFVFFEMTANSFDTAQVANPRFCNERVAPELTIVIATLWAITISTLWRNLLHLLEDLLCSRIDLSFTKNPATKSM